MSRIRDKNTKPELLVRRLAHASGYRFRLHRRDLPGSPDLVFSSRRKVVFVHGCFWHDHACRAHKRHKVTAGYWSDKLSTNVERDRRKQEALDKLGWETLVIWECETRDCEMLARTLLAFLGEPGQTATC